jgi:hypothetical protein
MKLGPRDGIPRAKSGARKAPLGGKRMVAEPTEEERRIKDRERLRRLLERAAHISEAPTPEIPPPTRGAHSPKYFNFLLAIAEGLTPSAASRRSGYSEQAGHRLWRNPETQQEVARIQAAMLEAHTRKIAHLRGLALARAEDILLDPETPAATVAALARDILDRSGLSASSRVQIDATVKTAPMAAMTADELLADLRLEYARAGLPAEEIEAKLIEARAMLPDDSR